MLRKQDVLNLLTSHDYNKNLTVKETTNLIELVSLIEDMDLNIFDYIFRETTLVSAGSIIRKKLQRDDITIVDLIEILLSTPIPDSASKKPTTLKQKILISDMVSEISSKYPNHKMPNIIVDIICKSLMDKSNYYSINIMFNYLKLIKSILKD